MKKKCLLHICCAPCATQTIECLNSEYSITGYFYNPNIEPLAEYNLRLDALFKLNSIVNIDLFIGDYDNRYWRKVIKGFENDKEGGKRCELCIDLRLKNAAYFASALKIKYYTTTLSISPYKNYELIKTLGEQYAKEYNIVFIAEDFKKNGGYKKSIELSKKYELYRQKYCGCKIQ